MNGYRAKLQEAGVKCYRANGAVSVWREDHCIGAAVDMRPAMEALAVCHSLGALAPSIDTSNLARLVDEGEAQACLATLRVAALSAHVRALIEACHVMQVHPLDDHLWNLTMEAVKAAERELTGKC